MTDAPDQGYAWIIVLACFFINFIMGGLMRTAGIMYVAVIDLYGISREAATTPFGVRMCIRSILGPVIGLLGQKYGIRRITALGGLVAGIGSMLCFFSPNILWMTLFWGFIHGIGVSMCTVLHMLAISQYFVKLKASALGIGCTGECFSSFVFPIVMEYLFATYDTRGVFVIIGGFILNIIPMGLLLRKPPWIRNVESEKLKNNSKRNTQKNPAIDSHSKNIEQNKVLKKYPQCLITVNEMEEDSRNSENAERTFGCDSNGYCNKAFESSEPNLGLLGNCDEIRSLTESDRSFDSNKSFHSLENVRPVTSSQKQYLNSGTNKEFRGFTGGFENTLDCRQSRSVTDLNRKHLQQKRDSLPPEFLKEKNLDHKSKRLESYHNGENGVTHDNEFNGNVIVKTRRSSFNTQVSQNSSDVMRNPSFDGKLRQNDFMGTSRQNSYSEFSKQKNVNNMNEHSQSHSTNKSMQGSEDETHEETRSRNTSFIGQVAENIANRMRNASFTSQVVMDGFVTTSHQESYSEFSEQKNVNDMNEQLQPRSTNKSMQYKEDDTPEVTRSRNTSFIGQVAENIANRMRNASFTSQVVMDGFATTSHQESYSEFPEQKNANDMNEQLQPSTTKSMQDKEDDTPEVTRSRNTSFIGQVAENIANRMRNASFTSQVVMDGFVTISHQESCLESSKEKNLNNENESPLSHNDVKNKTLQDDEVGETEVSKSRSSSFIGQVAQNIVSRIRTTSVTSQVALDGFVASVEFGTEFENKNEKPESLKGTKEEIEHADCDRKVIKFRTSSSGQETKDTAKELRNGSFVSQIGSQDRFVTEIDKGDESKPDQEVKSKNSDIENCPHYLPLPTDKNIIVHHEKPPTKIDNRSEELPKPPGMLKLLWQINSKPMFILISMTWAANSFSFGSLFTTIIDYAADIGITQDQGKYLLIGFSAADLIGRLSFGQFIDRNIMAMKNFTTTVMVIMGIFLAIIPLKRSFIYLMFCMCTYGVAQAGTAIIYPILINLYMDKSSESVAMGSINFLSGFFMLLIAPMIGFFRDNAGSYNGVFHIIGGIVAIVGTAWQFEPMILKFQDRKLQRM